MTLSRPLDYRYDPYYKSSNMRVTTRSGYRVQLQNTDVAGSDRPLFFAMPVRNATLDANADAPPPEIILAKNLGNTGPNTSTEKALNSTSKQEDEVFEKVDIMTQTMYRESEAQTDPWLPDTTDHVKPREWFDEEELENISLEERQQKLVALEVEQWAKRERAIVDLQQRRLQLLVNNFQVREEKEATKRRERVEAVLKAREEQRKKGVEMIEKKRLKVLRTLTEQRRQMTAKKHTKRDIVSDYADRGSSAYAPLRRQGRADAMCYMHPAVYGKRDITTDESLAALDELEQLYHQTTVTPLKAEKTMRRAERNHQEFLRTVERSVDEKRGQVEHKVQTLKIAQRIEKPPPRPPTPESKPGVENDEREMAVILIQRLLRGRALQSEMYHCLENQRQLIRELRTVEALKDAEETAEDEKEKEVIQQARQQREQAATTQGKVVGEMLAFLNHQLRRRLEERRIDAMMKLAERERRRREAEESGRREEELKRQAIEDEAFRKVMGINYETTESYLESIINRSIETAAEELATATAKRDAEKITKFTSTAANTHGDSAIVARDLVAAFLFPEVERDSIRKRLRIEQKKYRKAAEDAVAGIKNKI